jgi:hypothetical protein
MQSFALTAASIEKSPCRTLPLKFFLEKARANNVPLGAVQSLIGRLWRAKAARVLLLDKINLTPERFGGGQKFWAISGISEKNQGPRILRKSLIFNGTPCRIRTCDLRIRKNPGCSSNPL